MPCSKTSEPPARPCRPRNSFHTLIGTGGVGSEVFRDAFQQITGHQINRLADVTGRSEQVIFRETLELYGIEHPGGYFPKFVEAQAAGYRARADEMRHRGREAFSVILLT